MSKVPETIELEVAGPMGALKGSFLAPAKAAPVVLIIPGSGPTDRNGNSPVGLSASTYRLLAEALADQGVGSMRIDKRGMFASKAAVADANDVTISNYADDIGKWAERLVEGTGRPCVWLAGHSEGGLVALAAARDGAELYCGIILLEVPGRPLGTVLREQMAANPANASLVEEADSVISRLEKGERVEADRMTPILLTLFAPQVQGFLIDAMALDPAKLAAGTDLPILILQGTADLQVKAEDAAVLAAARPDAQLRLIEGMSHTLKQVAGEGPAANYATYLDASLPIDPQLVEAIVAFVGAKEDDT